MLSPLDFERAKLCMMRMGNGGQISSISLTAVLSEQTSRRYRRCGDPNTTFRHFRHTCASVCHQFSTSSTFSTLSTLDSTPMKSNISRRTSSGRMSMVIGPTLCQSVVVALQDFEEKNVHRFRLVRLFQVQECSSFLSVSDSEPCKLPSMWVDDTGWP